jgi:hypothetical protein
VDVTIALSPGVTAFASAQTGAGSGTVTCNGKVRGRSLDGTAPITLDTASTENCPGGSGTGTFTAGPLGPNGVTVLGDFEFTRTAFNDVTLQGTATIEGQGAAKTFVISGAFHYLFLQGNCVVTPMTLVGTQNSPPFTISYR